MKDIKLFTILYNILAHLKEGYDYTLVIVGDTGSGKSMFGLQLMEMWYKYLIKRPFTEKNINAVSTDFLEWTKYFQEMKEYDINIFDEGATGLEGKDYMETMSRQLTKLFNVFRCKKFFSIIILPSFFNLNKYFREHRLRGLVWINKRGEYKFFTKTGINWLNAENEGNNFKSMELARPFHWASFPNYTGILKEPYELKKDSGVDDILKETINSLEGDKFKGISLTDVYKDDVKKMVEKGLSHRDIREELQISGTTLARCLMMAKK